MVILRETLLTSVDCESSTDCCCLTYVEPEDAGNSAPSTAAVVVDVVVVVVDVDDDCVVPGVLDCVSTDCELVVVSKSL